MMDKTILTIFKVISLIFIALAVIFQIVVLVKGEDGVIGTGILDYYIQLSYVAVGIAAVLALAFPLYFMIQNPKDLLKIAGGIAILFVMGFICYSIADNTFNIAQLEKLKTTADISKFVGASLYFTYVLGGLAILSVVFSGISGLFK